MPGIASALPEADFEEDTELRDCIITEYNSYSEAHRRAYEENSVDMKNA